MSRMTFYQLISEYAIEMPIIQRGYVQGADDDETTDIRNNFVKALVHSLKEREELHLNFIYGKVEEGYFIPLDGQQRLTTLFLLHWYIAQHAEEAYQEQLKDKLSYFTQPSSKDFCSALGAKGKVLNREKPSKSIRQAPWFFKRWEKDATVRGMLTTLDTIDTIHQQFLSGQYQNNYWQLLASEECPITFDFLNLEEQKLTDELYLKMNARGLVLTEFEQFKAWLIEYLEDPNSDAVKAVKENLDGKWMDLFWKYRSEKDAQVDSEEDAKVDIDTPYMHFFRNYFQLLYLSSEEDELSEEKEKLASKLAPANQDEYPFFSTQDYKEVLEDKDKINEAFKALNKLCKLQKNDSLDKTFGIDLFTDASFFKGFVAKASTYKQRILFYAFIKALIEEKNNCLKSWMRVVRNLAENISFNNLQEFRSRIKLIDKLFEETLKGKDSSEAFYEALCHYEGSELTQFKEEKNKAKLIVKDKAWETIFLTYENHSYFRGHIQFLLDFEKEEKEKFQHYAECCALIFNTEKEKKNPFIGPPFLLHRALLLTDVLSSENGNGNMYPVQVNSNKKLMLKEEWRNYILANKKRNRLIRTLIDEVTESKKEEVITNDNLKQCFSDWINSKKGEISNKWQIKLINYPKIIFYARKKMIRYIHDNKVFVLGASGLNHYHRELYTHALFLSLEEKEIDLPNVSYNQEKTHWAPTFVVIDKIPFGSEEYAIHIEYDTKNNSVGYFLSIFNIKQEQEPHDDILKYMEEDLGLKPFDFDQQVPQQTKHRAVQNKHIKYRYQLGKNQNTAEEKLIELCNMMANKESESIT